MNYNLSVDQRFIISHLKEMYDSNNRVLNSITQIHNQNINSETINNLINNLISSNNEIMRNVTNLSNTNNNINTNTNNNLNTNNRQQGNRQNSVRHQNIQQNNNRQQSNNRQNRYNNYIYDSIYNYPNSRASDARISNLIYSFLEPIEIFPTPSQIESATRVVRFGDIIRPLNTACPITLENFNENDQVLVIRQCSHVFSNIGLTSWFRTNCRCPVCRFDIRNYISIHPSNISELSSNVDNSSNILPSSLTSLERRVQNNPSSVLIDLIFSNLLDTRNVTDISGNTVSDNNHDVSDISGNLLHFFFTR